MTSRNCSLLATCALVVMSQSGMQVVRAAAKDDARTAFAEEDLWRTQNRCGINSLYAMLRLNDRMVSYDQLLENVPISASGTSMTDLRDVLSNHGIESTVVKTDPESLQGQQFPAIAFVWKSESRQGHFIVLCEVTSKAVQFIDGTTGALAVENMKEFCSRWDGHLLIRSDEDAVAQYLWCVIGLLGVGLCCQPLLLKSTPRSAGEHDLSGE